MNAHARAALDHFGRFAEAFWPAVEPVPMVPNWHMGLICDALQNVAEGRLQRLCICIPPRHSKSLLASVLWPAWLHTRNPALKLLTASHTMKLARTFSRMHREIIRSRLYRRHYGRRTALKPGRDAVDEWHTTRGGKRIIGAVGSHITGFGGEVLIIDDPHDLGDIDNVNAREEVAFWYRSAWLTRRDDDTASEVIIMQRSAADDLVGEVASYGFKTLSIPAIQTADPPPSDIPFEDPRKVGEPLAPDRVGLQTLHAQRDRMGRHFHAVYQQDPRPQGDGLFMRDWFGEPPAGWQDEVAARMRYWDKAATRAEKGRDPDWTVGALVARLKGEPHRFVIENLIRMRDSPMKTEARQVAAADADGTKVWIAEEQEPGAAGVEAMVRRAAALQRYAFSPDKKMVSKEERWNGLSVQAEAGHVYCVRAPWNEAMFSEFEAAPNGRHDDQLDAVAGAVARLGRRVRV